MRQHRWFLVFLILAGLVVAEAVAASQPTRLAQNDQTPGAGRQRAPGVPMAPKPGAVEKLERERDGTAVRVPSQRQEQARNTRGANRDLPMLKPVPSIIAP
jgi:hypothetical protein